MTKPHSFLSRLQQSVLPLELAQDVYSHSTADPERAKLAGMLLTVLFSRGEPLPVHYLEPGQIGRNFVDFVLEIIEKPVQKRHHDLSDVYIGMMLSYNLQFADLESNIFIERPDRPRGSTAARSSPCRSWLRPPSVPAAR